MNIKGWDAQLDMRLIHSHKVPVNSEHLDSAVVSSVGLSTFNTFDGVVESSVGGVQHEGLVRHDFRTLPASVGVVVVYLQSVVG